MRLVHDIDLWMIRECCRWFTRFAEHGITRINVNLSPQTCMVETVWEEISSCLDRYGLQHGKIWLEMTELGKSADNGNSWRPHTGCRIRSSTWSWMISARANPISCG